MSKNKISPEAQAILSAADAGLHATTVGLVEKFLLANPDSIRAWLDLGQSLGQLGRYEKAEKAFLKVIEISGADAAPEMYGEIGNLYRSKGDFETAASWYRKFIDSQPGNSMGYLYLGNLLLRQGEFDSAESAFESALNCDEVCREEVYYSLGLVYRSMGRLSDAMRQFKKCLELDDRFQEAKVGLRDVKSAMG